MHIDLRTLLLSLPLACVAAGCSGSGSGGGGFAATASTAGGSTAGPGSQPAGPGLPAIPAAPANATSGVDAFNAELQLVWNRLLPDLKAQLQQQAAQGLSGKIYDRGAIEVEIVNVQTVQSQMAEAPGLTSLTPDRLQLRLPRSSTWELVLQADVRVRFIIGSFTPHVDLPVKVTVSNLSAQVEAEFDQTDPTRPVLRRVGTPAVHFDVAIDSSSSLLSQITPVLSPVANVLAHYALNQALSGLLPVLSSLPGLPGPVPGDGAAPWADSGTPVDFEGIMTRIDRKIRQHHLPHGTILGAVMDTPAHDSWEDAYGVGGPGVQGAVVRWGSGGDSAIFTGQYLAAQAFRYAATRDPDALGGVHQVLGGVGKLLAVNGDRGLLARCAAPVGSTVASSFSHTYGQAVINGQPWIGEQGSNGISRDQYSGVFFGLSITYELVDDPLVRAECQRLLQMMLDYLIAHDWIVDEDRPAIPTSRGPTFWAGVGTQKVTFLLMGHRMSPAKYAARVAEAGGVSEFAWIGAWTGVMGIDHYYKFNLSHMAYYNYFRLESDPQRWQDFGRAFRIMRRYVGHHKNPFFDLVASSVDPSQSAVYFPQTREVVRRFLRRNHREVAPPVVDLSNVTFVPVTQTGYQNGTGSSFTVTTTTTMMPSEPLDIVLRNYTGHFLWQRDPFTPATPNAGNDKAEKHGLDAVLPYWMGRHHGAF